MDGPNPITALFSILKARRLRPPRPGGTAGAAVEGFDEILAAVASGGVPAIPTKPLNAFLERMKAVDPDTLSRDSALSFWINLYNAGALDLAHRAFDTTEQTVLRVPGGFSDPFIEVADERLSLDGIEHGKIRRFGDPRIHSALVCGSVSCPTLRHEAYRGDHLDAQLDDQMRSFLTSGAVTADREAETISLSRVFLWYGSDFVRPSRMPTLLPAGRSKVLESIRRWIPEDLTWIDENRPRIVFQDYDWAIGCSVRRPA